MGDSSWCSSYNTFFPREASLCGKSECYKLQAPPKQSSGICKDLWRTAGQLSRSPLALTWLLNRAVLGWQSHIYGLFIPVWAVFCYPMAKNCLAGQHFGGSGGGISKRHWLGAVLLVSELLQQGNAVIQGLCSVIALGGCWKTAREAQGHVNRWCLIHGGERGLVCSQCSSGRGWWGSARLCSIRGTSLPRGFQLPSTGSIRGSHCLSGNKGRRSQPHRFFFSSCKPLPPV